MNVQDFLKKKSDKTVAALRLYLDGWSTAPEILREAMAYSLFAGGKRLRPALVLGAAEMLSGDDSSAMPAACAIEMIHTYSLIHDDLPAMDNDDVRRGKPTCHKVFGEATALLAGDALLTMAFEVAAETNDIRVVRELAHVAGIEGMAGGQFLDLTSEGQTLGLESLQQIHAMKTGALIQGALRSGAFLGGASAEQLSALTEYGKYIGLAFQIADDILNVVGDAEALGKPVGSDAGKAKITYPALLGLEEARSCAQEAVNKAKGALSIFGTEGALFSALADYIVTRNA